MEHDTEEPTWIDELRKTIWDCGTPIGITRTLNWIIDPDGEGGWSIRVAPVYQEVFGGDQDGEIVWTPFVFDVNAFLEKIDSRFDIEGFSIVSYDQRLDTLPMLLIQAKRDGVPVLIAIQLEPPQKQPAVEIIDTISGVARPKEPRPD